MRNQFMTNFKSKFKLYCSLTSVFSHYSSRLWFKMLFGDFLWQFGTWKILKIWFLGCFSEARLKLLIAFKFWIAYNFCNFAKNQKLISSPLRLHTSTIPTNSSPSTTQFPHFFIGIKQLRFCDLLLIGCKIIVRLSTLFFYLACISNFKASFNLLHLENSSSTTF